MLAVRVLLATMATLAATLTEPEWKLVNVKSRGANGNVLWQCDHCKNDYTSTATRVRMHLAGVARGGIAACTSVPADVRATMLAAHKAALARTATREEQAAAIGAACSKQPGSNKRQLGIRAALDRSVKADADKKVAMFFYENGVPFNVARSPAFKEMLQVSPAAAQLGCVHADATA